MTIRVGCGYDVHQLVPGRKLVLGGVEIPHDRGLRGHSDADVLAHALCDAILGAIGEGDLGQHFPDTDPHFRGISSLTLLAEVVALARARGFAIGNADATVLAERPPLAPHLQDMVEHLAKVLQTEVGRVNVKAKRGEGVGFVGRQEGIAAYAVVTVQEIPAAHEPEE